MSCCTPSGYRTIFGARTVERDARRYRRHGLVRSARWLFGRLSAAGLAGYSVLEVGGGIGDLQVELLQAGAEHATNIEIVDTYEQAARRLIADRGLERRIVRRVGDFALQADDAPAADIVVLHRVVCCYADPGTLITAACAHSRGRVAVTLPRESWWVKVGATLTNAWFRARRIGFRVYVHPVAPMLAVAAAAGFQPAAAHRGAVWSSMILVRGPAAPRGHDCA